MTIGDFAPILALCASVIIIGFLFKHHNERRKREAYDHKLIDPFVTYTEEVKELCLKVVKESEAIFESDSYMPDTEAMRWPLAVSQLWFLAQKIADGPKWEGSAAIGYLVLNRQNRYMRAALLQITDMVILKSPEHLASLIDQLNMKHVQDMLSDIPGANRILTIHLEAVAEDYKKKLGGVEK